MDSIKDNSTRSKELLKGTGIYAIGTFGTKILSLIIVPLYTYYISTSEMGIYDLLVSTISLLSPIITMQISDAAYRWIIRGEGDNTIYIKATYQVLLFNCFLAFALVLAANTIFSIPYCSYFAVLLILTRCLETSQKLLRALKHQKLFAVSGIVYSIVFLSLNVFSVCVLHKGIESLFLNSIISCAISISLIVLSVKELRVNIFGRPDFDIIKQFYLFSIPLVPNYLNWWVINSSDRYIVLGFLGVSANGILAITHKFPSLLQTLLNLFTTSWQDSAVSEHEKNIGSYYTKVFKTYSKLVLSVLWLLIPATKIFINLVMSDAYKESCNYVAFYYLGAVFQSFASFYGVGYLRNKQTKKAFSTSVYGALINGASNLMLVSFIGLQASAVSTLLGFLLMWLVREKQNRAELGIKIDVFKMASYTIASIGIAIISNLISYSWNYILLLVGFIAFVLVNLNDFVLIYHFLLKKVIKK